MLRNSSKITVHFDRTSDRIPFDFIRAAADAVIFINRSSAMLKKNALTKTKI